MSCQTIPEINYFDLPEIPTRPLDLYSDKENKSSEYLYNELYRLMTYTLLLENWCYSTENLVSVKKNK